MVFEPDRRSGVIFQIGAILLLILASGWGIWNAAHSSIGPTFLIFLLPALFTFILVPILAYRLYSLLGAYYHLERDGIRLRWGLRIEDIPMDKITWISRDSALKRRLPLPWLRWPGSVLGVRHTADGETLEFMASRSSSVVLIAAGEQIYVISPYQSDDFLHTLQSLMELGSLSSIPAQSVHPSFLLARIWRLRTARVLIVLGLVLNLLLLVWVSLAIPARSSIILGFARPDEPVPTVRLLLIPVISSLFFLMDLLLGLFFFRRAVDLPPTAAAVLEPDYAPPSLVNAGRTSEPAIADGDRFNQVFWSLRIGFSLVPGQYLAHMLWGSGALVSALFLLATFFILNYSN